MSVVLSFLPQIAVADLNAEELPPYHRNIDMDEVMLAHADEDPKGRRSGGFSFTPQGVLHGADEAFRTPNFRPDPHRGCGGRSPASASTPIGR